MKRPTRNPERGNALVLAMIVLTALGTLSSLTVVSVQGGLATTSNDRFHSIATYAAESGGAAGMEFLRANVNPGSGWASYLSASNATIQAPSGIVGNNIYPGVAGNPFSTDQQAWYRVEIVNNRNDTGYATGADVDKRVILRVTGHGPGGAIAQLEWEVTAGAVGMSGTPCNTYAQRNISENGGGAADCLGTISNTDVGTMRPGG